MRGQVPVETPPVERPRRVPAAQFLGDTIPGISQFLTKFGGPIYTIVGLYRPYIGISPIWDRRPNSWSPRSPGRSGTPEFGLDLPGSLPWVCETASHVVHRNQVLPSEQVECRRGRDDLELRGWLARSADLASQCRRNKTNKQINLSYTQVYLWFLIKVSPP